MKDVMMNKKVIIFDMDGVLFNSIDIAAQYLEERYPKLTREIQKELLAGNFHEELDKFKQMHGYRTLTGPEADANNKAYALKKSNAPMYEGVHEMLKDLHGRGFILVLNTSAWERNCLPLLEKQNVFNLFDFVATAELSKNKTEKFRLIENRYGAERESTLFVTDTLGDLIEAEAADVPTVCVTWGGHDKTYFYRKPHKNLIGVVDTVYELKDFILQY